MVGLYKGYQGAGFEHKEMNQIWDGRTKSFSKTINSKAVIARVLAVKKSQKKCHVFHF